MNLCSVTKPVLLTALFFMTVEAYGIDVPKPMGIDIDDLGWKRGWSTAETGGPWRVGLPEGRWMSKEDYEVLVYVGKSVGVRLKCLFIMCEFDRSNICADYPTTTWLGGDWDNSALVDDSDFAIMNYIKDNAAYIEFGLHGVGHEHWDAETHERTRAEWANGIDPWPFEDVWGHMECFKKIIDQYEISFPKSVRTAAARYYYNPSDARDSGGLMHNWGVKYATLPPPREYVTDHGLMVLERSGGVGWDAISSAPSDFPSTEIMTSHWANFVQENPAENHRAGDKWITWFNMVKDTSDRYVPKNTAQLYSQFLYRKMSDITIDGNTVNIDNTNMPDWAYDLDLLGNLLLKHKLGEGEHILSAELDSGDIACYYEDRGYAFIILPKLDKQKYTLTFSTGPSDMITYVLNEGTYNVEKFESNYDSAKVSLEMYGTQKVKVKLLFKPQEVRSDNSDLIVREWSYEAPFINMLVLGKDVQGEKGTIFIK